MYDLISDNIISSASGISFIYKLPSFNTELGNEFAKESAEKLITDLIKKVCLGGEIIIIPKLSTSKEIISKYYKGISDDDKIGTKFRDELEVQLKSKNLQEYITYIVFNETDVKLSKKNVLTNKKKIVSLSEKRKKALIEYSKLIYAEMIQRSNLIEILDASETIELINYMNFSQTKVVSDHVFHVNSNNMKVTTESEEGKLVTKYINYFQVSEMPDNYKNSISLIENLKKLHFPIDINIKFDVHLNNIKLEKQLKNAKRDFQKMNNKYKRYHDDDNGLLEYENKIRIANSGVKEFQKESTALLDFQVNLRLHSSLGPDRLEKRYQMIKKIFRNYKINLVSALGNQQILNEHFQIGSMYYSENILKLSDSYINNLALLSGSKIGTSEINSSTIQAYQVPANIPVFIDEYAPLRGLTKQTQSTICYMGTSGSGKSQLVNYHFLQNMIVNKAKVLVLDPKGDRKDFFKENRDLIDDYTEVVIGKNLEYKGCMDYFKSDNTTEDKVLNLVDLIIKFYKISKKDRELDLYFIQKHITYYIENYNVNSMIGFMNYLYQINEDTAMLIDILKTFENMAYSNLFYSKDLETNSINFDNQLTIIILDSIEESEQGTIKSILFNHVYKSITLFVKDFVRKIDRDIPSEVVLEELAYLREQVGTKLDDEISRICRSFGVLFRYVLQNPSDISEATKNNTGTYYIGVVENSDELEILTKAFSLSLDKIKFIQANNDREGVKEVDKYNFLLIDPNKRKSKIKADFLPMFENMFNTHVKEKNA